MTVEELINKLSKFDKNLNVDISDNGIYMNIGNIRKISWKENEVEHCTVTLDVEKYNTDDSIVKS